MKCRSSMSSAAKEAPVIWGHAKSDANFHDVTDFPYIIPPTTKSHDPVVFCRNFKN